MDINAIHDDDIDAIQHRRDKRHKKSKDRKGKGKERGRDKKPKDRKEKPSKQREYVKAKFPPPKRPLASSSNLPTLGAFDPTTAKCFRCGQIGHTIKNCVTRIRSMDEHEGSDNDESTESDSDETNDDEDDEETEKEEDTSTSSLPASMTDNKDF